MKIPLTWAHERAGIPMPAGDQEAILYPRTSTDATVGNEQLATAPTGNLSAANSAHIPLDEQAVQLQLQIRLKKPSKLLNFGCMI
jgi:phage gp29-like protein